MSFTSVEFILLVTAAVVLYYLVPKRFQWIVLLAANYIFYLCGGVLLTGYLLAATVCTYAAGLALERLNAKKGQLDKNLWKRRKKSVAAAALIARASQKRLGKKTAVLIGVAAFVLAVVVVILLARTAMPL